MFVARSSPAVRAIARRTVMNKLASHAVPLRNASSHHHPTGGSDLPWIIGSVGLTVPGAWYLLSTGSPKPSHSDPHKQMDTVPTSPVQSMPAEQHSSLEQPKEKPEPKAEEAEEGGGSSASASNAVDETASSASDKVKGKASELSEKAKDKTSDLVERAKEGPDPKGHGHDEEASGEKENKTSINPQKADPGDIAEKDAGSMNVQSGKQEGLSNDDTRHVSFGDERGETISKKGEGYHESAKAKGTVDANRPAK